MPTVYLGNTSPTNNDGDTYQVTTVHANEANRADNLAVIRSLWPYHAEKPVAWVESEDQRLAEDIADVFSDENHVCVVGRPENWGEAPELSAEESVEEPIEGDSVDNG